MRARRLLVAVATSALLCAIAVGAAAMSPRLQKQGSLYRIEKCGVAYGFDAAWRVETLWVRAESGRWEKVKDAADPRLGTMRQLFLSWTGKGSLKEVPVEGRIEMRSLKSLGYL